MGWAVFETFVSDSTTMFVGGLFPLQLTMEPFRYLQVTKAGGKPWRLKYRFGGKEFLLASCPSRLYL